VTDAQETALSHRQKVEDEAASEATRIREEAANEASRIIAKARETLDNIASQARRSKDKNLIAALQGMLQDPGIQRQVATSPSEELSDFGDLAWREDEGTSIPDTQVAGQSSDQSIDEEISLVEDVSVWESPKRRRFGRSK
jgi:cell division septum initiation protein DivIVA